MSRQRHHPRGGRADAGPAPRESCWRCHRPAAACLCRHFAGVAPVENRTGVVILQHARERFHHLGTAPIALLGLRRCELRVAGERHLSGLRLEPRVRPGAGVLYPSPGAVPLHQVPAAQRPGELLLLDGTWNNARKLHRANPWLLALPHFRLLPAAPGRYRIRGEPTPHSLSTIEALVQALQLLEPETPGLQGLLSVFEAMIDSQVAHISAHREGPRRARARRRRPRPLPAALGEGFADLVLAYVEAVDSGAGFTPVQLCALRPASGEHLELIAPVAGAPGAAQHLAHLQLPPAARAAGLSQPELRARWQRFVRPGDVLAAWNQRSLDLLLPLTPAPAPPALMLKGIYCNLRRSACGALAEVVRREGLDPPPAPFAGRAAARMGQALAVLRLLHAQATCRTGG